MSANMVNLPWAKDAALSWARPDRAGGVKDASWHTRETSAGASFWTRSRLGVLQERLTTASAGSSQS
jgi:hypothetical protein